MGLVNRLDRVIGAIAPTWALRRARSRAQLALLDTSTRRFEAADRGRRTQGWLTLDSSANAATRSGLHLLRARCRDLRRNNPFAGSAVRELAINVAGRGLRPRFTSESDQELRLATEAWEEWGQITAADVAGRDTFMGMQAAAIEAVVDGGECLIMRRLRRWKGLEVPLKLELLEGDHIDTLRESGPPDRVVQGIAFGDEGRSGYWLHPEHPGEQWTSEAFLSSRFVPASEILHVYRLDRIGQARGVPWGAVVALRMHDFDKYEDFELQRMLIATAFAGFEHDLAGPDESYTDGVLGALATAEQNKNRLNQAIDEIHGGTIQHLPEGKTITFSNPPQNNGFEAFARVELRAIARGYGVPAWLITGDLSGIPFSAVRADWVAFNRHVDSIRDRILIPHVCEPGLRWWRDAAELVDVLTPGRPISERLRWEWIPPRREMLDPRTEVTAEIESVRAGFKSISQVIQSLGSDPERVLTALAEDLASARAKGLKLSTDGQNAAPGRIQSTNAATANGQAAADAEDQDEADQAETEEEDRQARRLVELLQARGFSLGDAISQIVGP